MDRESRREAERLEELDNLQWQAMRNSASFDRILAIASAATGVGTVLLNLVGHETQETLAARNWVGATSIPREHSICSRTVIREAPLEYPDLQQSPETCQHPAVTGSAGLRYYAGAPVVTRRGYCVGALCVIDTAPNALEPPQMKNLQGLADIAAELLEVHRAGVLGARLEADRRQEETDSRLHLYQRALESSSNSVIISDALDPSMGILYVNPAFETLTGYTLEEVVGQNCRFLQGMDTDQSARRELRAAITERRDGRAVMRNFRKDGTEFWVDVRLSPVHVGGRVTHFVGFQVDVTDRIRRERELAYMATHDPLTGLPNRALLKDRLLQTLERHRPTRTPFAVVFIDLDRFKLINDSLGHSSGDKLLCAVAGSLSERVGHLGTVARMGGDEFVLVLTEFHDARELTAIIEDVHRELRRPRGAGYDEVVIEASIGIAVYPEHGEDAVTLLRNADAAMYHAKSRGRAQSQFYLAAMTAGAGDKLTLHTELHRALELGEFTLHYQPQLFRDGGLSGLEALIRWNHPVRGLLYPGSFIAAIEEFGLIEAVGNWVLREACRQNRAWQEADLFHVPIAVNVSVGQLRKATFVEDVDAVLQETGLPARFLDLEITESMVMEAPERIVDLLVRLRRLGTRASIDDFGTGHSSLSFIRRFALDALKIDKSFVRDISTDPTAASLCDTIIRMAHNLGFRVIAEGVETVEQATFLEEHGCDVLQGFLFSEAKSPAEMVVTMAQRGWTHTHHAPEHSGEDPAG